MTLSVPPRTWAQEPGTRSAIRGFNPVSRPPVTTQKMWISAGSWRLIVFVSTKLVPIAEIILWRCSLWVKRHGLGWPFLQRTIYRMCDESLRDICSNAANSRMINARLWPILTNDDTWKYCKWKKKKNFNINTVKFK